MSTHTRLRSLLNMPPVTRPISELIRRNASLLIWFTLGTVIAFLYFRWLLDFNVYYRVRGDAYHYLKLAEGAHGLLDVFNVYETRNPGFPLVLKLLQELITPFISGGREPWFEFAPNFFFVFHIATMALLFRSASEFLRRRYGFAELHPVWLFLLLIHPGLVAYTSVLLADIWTNDLVLLGIALLAATYDNGSRKGWATWGAAGLFFAWAVYSRNEAIVGVIAGIAALMVSMAIESRRDADSAPGRRWVPPAKIYFLAGSFGLVTILSSLPCSLHYGVICQVKPGFSAQVVGTSLVTGLSNVRTYWSWTEAARGVSGPAVVDDPWLKTHLRDACGLDVVVQKGKAAIGCLVARPWTWPLYFPKKIMALLDQQHYQPYLAGFEPPPTRRVFEYFSALSWAGVALLIGWALIRVRRYPAAVALALFPLCTLFVHSLMHVEYRYSIGSVPLGFVALAVVHKEFITLLRRDTARAMSLLAVVILLIGVFVWQVGEWNALDVNQQYADSVLLRK